MPWQLSYHVTHMQIYDLARSWELELKEKVFSWDFNYELINPGWDGSWNTRRGHQTCNILTPCCILFAIINSLWRNSWSCISRCKADSRFALGWGGWGCEFFCGGHHRQRGKTTTGSALDGAVLDFTQIQAYLVHNISRSQLYLGFGHFGWIPSFLGQ